MMQRAATILGVFILCCFVASPATLAQSSLPNDPLAMVDAIYTRVISGGGDLGGAFMQERKSTKAKYFSRSLIALWAKADAHVPNGDIGPIDFDLATNSQDPMIKSFTATAEKSDSGTATIMVTLQRGSEQPRANAADDVLRYDLVRDGDHWRIDDIRGANDGKPWSMRAKLNWALRH